MQLGVCTWTFGDLPLADIARRLFNLGYDGVELLGDLGRYTAGEARQILADHNLQVFSLTPANVDLAHPDPAVYQEALAYYRRLLDFAAELGQPLVSVHGYVGRVRPVTSLAAERALFVQAVQHLAVAGQKRGIHLVVEVLNRYETHLIHTGQEAVEFIQDVGANNVGVLLDAYHMNIEEPDPAAAIRQAGNQLWLYHAADSNRQGLGRGHTDFTAQFRALADSGYTGPVIMECTAPGPDPFTPVKDEYYLDWLETYLRESRRWVSEASD